VNLAAIGTWEILLILLLALLLYGGRLPQVARSLGRGLFEFRRGLRELEEEIKQEIGVDELKEEIESVRQEVESQGAKEPMGQTGKEDSAGEGERAKAVSADDVQAQDQPPPPSSMAG
jgi:TatA/E family protein of Tat protein translocase